jgi:hypothetical protein
MSPELTVLDELLGRDVPLDRVLSFFESGEKFRRSIFAILEAGEIRLLNLKDEEVPSWDWRPALSEAPLGSHRISITDKGTARIA